MKPTRPRSASRFCRRLAAAVGASTVLVVAAVSQPAMAKPAKNASVGCDTNELSDAISGATDGSTLVLAPGCTYALQNVDNQTNALGANGLPVIDHDIQ